MGIDDDTGHLQLASDLIKPPWLIKAAAMLARADDEQPFIVPGVIPDSAITMIYGRPGAKKSWLAYTLAISVARGEDWLGFGEALQGEVIVFNLDNPTALVGRRMRQLGMTQDDPIYFHSLESSAFRYPDDAGKYTGIVELIKPSLIVIDSFRQAHTCDENDSRAMADLMWQIKPLRRYCGIVLVHHANKSNGDMRGSTEIEASCDAMLQVDSDRVTWIKHRGWEMPDDTFGFSLTDRGDGRERRTSLKRVPLKKRGEK